MSLRGVWHFSFTVSNLERSISFYRDILQLHLIHTQYQDNAYTRRLVGYPNARLRVAQFRIPGEPIGPSGHHLELVENLSPRGSRGDPGICNPGAAHLAVIVEDIFSFYDYLIEKKVHFVSPPNLITAGINKGGYTCYFFDPDEIILELVQPRKENVSHGWASGTEAKGGYSDPVLKRRFKEGRARGDSSSRRRSCG
jgi:catechol 2,3-dioxygenase-like lactoylglutathione lyase family enzyme